jgi:hypothetical protein
MRDPSADEGHSTGFRVTLQGEETSADGFPANRAKTVTLDHE